MKNLNFDAQLEVKFLAETGVFEGYASVFNVTDKVNDIIVQGAFKESLKVYAKKGFLPPMLWQHNTAAPIGRWLEMYEDDHGLFVKGELFINDLKTAREAYKLLKDGLVNGLSIGYCVKSSHKKGKLRILTEVDLQEVSLVTFPANDYARVSNIVKPTASNNNAPTERELEAILRSGGLSRRQAKGVVACGYKALNVPDDNELQAIKELKDKILKATAELKHK